MEKLQKALNEANEAVDELTQKQKLALYSKAGFIKTRYSDKVYKELAPMLGADGELNELGRFTVGILRRRDRERIGERTRTEAAKQLEPLRSITLGRDRGQSGSGSDLSRDDQWDAD